MTEAVNDPNYNPFDVENLAHGGGLWDGKIITVVGAKAVVEAMVRKDGTPVMETGRDGKPTGRQSVFTGLKLGAIAEGEEKERFENYGIGEKLAVTPEGDVVSKDGGVVKFHANSGMGKLAAALATAGFDTKPMVRDGGRRVSFGPLIAQRFLMKAEVKLGKDGKALKDQKGYDKQSFYPLKYVGASAGAPVAAATPSAGGGANALHEKAVTAVLTALTDGPLTRSDLVRKLAAGGTGNDIIGVVIQDAFHKDRPWKYDGTTLSLS